MEDRRTGMGIDSPAEKPARDPSLPLGILSETFPGGVLETALPQGDAVAVVAPGHLLKVMEFLKNDARLRFNMLADVTAVDYLGREPRFDLVYHLVSIPLGQRLRIKVRPADPGHTHDRRADGPGPQGNVHSRGRQVGGDIDPLLLLSPGPASRRELPHVPG
jgi:hypothetical protein